MPETRRRKNFNKNLDKSRIIVILPQTKYFLAFHILLLFRSSKGSITKLQIMRISGNSITWHPVVTITDLTLFH